MPVPESKTAKFLLTLLVPIVVGLLSHCAPTEPVPPEATDSPPEKLAGCLVTARLTTLTPETVRSHIFESCYWLTEASRTGTLEDALAAALLANSEQDSALAKETGEALTRNLERLKELGCLDMAGLEMMRQGLPPTIRSGANQGASVSLIHIIPPSRVQDLANQAFNFTIPESTSATGTSPELKLQFARRWNWLGLLDDRGYATIIYAFPSKGAH